MGFLSFVRDLYPFLLMLVLGIPLINKEWEAKQLNAAGHLRAPSEAFPFVPENAVLKGFVKACLRHVKAFLKAFERPLLRKTIWKYRDSLSLFFQGCFKAV